MQYVSEDERKVIEKCSTGELEADDKNLFELLITFDCKRIVTESTNPENHDLVGPPRDNSKTTVRNRMLETNTRCLNREFTHC